MVFQLYAHAFKLKYVVRWTFFFWLCRSLALVYSDHFLLQRNSFLTKKAGISWEWYVYSFMPTSPNPILVHSPDSWLFMLHSKRNREWGSGYYHHSCRWQGSVCSYFKIYWCVLPFGISVPQTCLSYEPNF